MRNESLDAIKRVIAAFEQSDWAEIDVQSAGIRIHLATGTTTTTTTTTQAAPQPVGATPQHQPETKTTATSAPPPTVDNAALPVNAHVVVSPSPGTVWRSPQPGAPHFADVGDHVNAASTLCIVEVMKLMNHLKAGMAGTVVAVYGRNGESVAKGEPLFAIVPGSPS